MSGPSKTIRRTNLQLGPIGLEVNVMSAVEDEDAGLVSVCLHDTVSDEQLASMGVTRETSPSTIKRRDYCPVCDNDAKGTFHKAKIVGGAAVLIDATALQALVAADEPTKKNIELTVHPAAQLTAAFPSGKSYWLAPRSAAGGANYGLLATLLAMRPDLGFIGQFSFNGAPALYQLVVSEGMLMMRQLARPSALRDRPVVAVEGESAFLELAEKFADTICAQYDPADYGNQRSAAVAALVEASVPVALAGEGQSVSVVSASVDLAAALTAAMAKAAPAPVKPARKRAVRKVAALAEDVQIAS